MFLCKICEVEVDSLFVPGDIKNLSPGDEVTYREDGVDYKVTIHTMTCAPCLKRSKEVDEDDVG